jgi:hypothetical protein
MLTREKPKSNEKGAYKTLYVVNGYVMTAGVSLPKIDQNSVKVDPSTVGAWPWYYCFKPTPSVEGPDLIFIDDCGNNDCRPDWTFRVFDCAG